MTHSTYRPDIDGLRAVAVLAVVLNHAGFGFVSGGFIGVDIFFVISGYLITTILYAEIGQNIFSFKVFYARRARRILPAFFLVSLTTVAAGAILMLPDDFQRLIDSFFASSLFVANFFFMLVSDGYFSVAAHEMPLLHMWSLSVEEQFYLLWPLLLLALARRLSPGQLAMTIVSLMLISFCIAQYWLSNAANTAYFSIASRAGELLFGALLAVTPGKGLLTHTPRAQLVSIIGLLLLFGSIVLISDSTPFPGIHALWPCIGATLLIWSGGNSNTIGYRLLSLRPLVFIGLISYSLYLWHWPFLAFTRYMRFEISAVLGVGFVLLSIGCAYLSWRYVEQPFRRKESTAAWHLTKSSLTLVTVAAVACIAAGRLGLISLQSFDEESYENAKSKVMFPSLRNGWCHVDSEDGFNLPFEQRYLDCRYGADPGEFKALLWGDSHAASYAPFVDYLGKELGFSVIEMSTSACAPTLSAIAGNQWRFQVPVCNGFRVEALKRIQNREYDVVFFAARWEGYSEVLESKIREALGFAAQNSKKVVVLAQAPRFEQNIAQCYVQGQVLPLSNGCDANNTYHAMAEVNSVNHRLSAIVEDIPNAQLIDITELVCTADNCSPFVSQSPVYFDDNHLSIQGARKLAALYAATRQGKAAFEAILNSVATGPE